MALSNDMEETDHLVFTKINKNYLGKDLTLTEHYVLCVFRFVLAFLHIVS